MRKSKYLLCICSKSDERRLILLFQNVKRNSFSRRESLAVPVCGFKCDFLIMKQAANQPQGDIFTFIHTSTSCLSKFPRDRHETPSPETMDNVDVMTSSCSLYVSVD